MGRVAPPTGKSSSWTQLPKVFAGALYDAVKVLTVLDAGNGPALHAAGKFTTPGPWSATSVARWDGGSWVPLGKSLDDNSTTIEPVIHALTTFDAPAGRVIVAAGNIDIVDDVAFGNIAQWDGATWRPVGTGVNGFGEVFALAQHDDGHGRALFAGGDFDFMGGEPATGIARWNGSRWSTVGRNARGTFRSLAAFDDGRGRALFATGSLSLDGSTEAESVLRWDGSAWTAVGASFDGRVERIVAVDDGTGPALYAVGAFVKAGTTTVNRVARWDGTAWVTAGSDLGSGIVYDLAAFDDGTGPALFAAGRFAYGTFGKKSDRGFLDAAGEVYYLAKLRRPLVCSAPDTTPPTLAITSPAPAAILDTLTPQIALSYADAGSGVDTASLLVAANGSPLAVSCSYGISSATCTPSSPLAEGQVDLSATVRDADGNVSATAAVTFRISVGAPSIAIASPADNAVLTSNTPRLTINYSPSSIPSTLDLQISSLTAVTVACSLGAIQALCDPEEPFADGATTVTATIENGAGDLSTPAVVHFVVDTLPPTVSFTAPATGAAVRTNRPQLRLALADAGAGIDDTSLELREAGALVATSCAFDATGATCTPSAPLADGGHVLTATVRDRTGKLSAAATVSFTVDTSDTTRPTITVTTPTLTDQPNVSVAGSVSEEATLTINGAVAAVASDLTFSFGPVSLAEGPNAFTFVATDLAGNVGTRDLTIVRTTDPDVTPPEPVRLELVTIVELAPGEHRITGGVGAVTSEAGLRVVVTNLATGTSIEATPAADGGFELTLSAFDGDILRLVARDVAGNESAPGELTVSGTTPVPADPAAVAPPLDPSSSIDACGLVSFFWTGTARVQFGVRPEAIDCGRLAVVRGRVLDGGGAPIAGVRIGAIGQPDHGFTFSRADGAFDVAVRAQQRVVLTFSRAGYFAAQRTLPLLPQQFTTINDLVLVAPDSAITAVDTSGSAPAQVARGSVVSDEWGSRRTTLLFPAGTTGALRLPGGELQPLAMMDLRVTELSVGPMARAALPATLPPELVLSHAMEISVDAAEAAGAEVELGRPVAVYVKNHLDAPVGTAVDLYTLDRKTATWVPLPPGRIVKLLAATAGLAELDVDGSGAAASPEALQALGIDDTERAQLAALYSPGQSLSRVTVTHFSFYVEGWFRRSQVQLPAPIVTPPVPGDDSKIDHPSITAFGGTIEAENQILGQDLGLAGTPYVLHYSSDRVPGRRAPYRLTVRLTGAGVPPALLALVRRIDLTIDIAGHHYVRAFEPAPDLSHEFTWNRQDGYGREIQGEAPWVARLSYVSALGPSEHAHTYTYSGRLGTLDAQGAQGLGGWTVSASHFFDEPNGTLYYGDGRRRTLRSRANNPKVLEQVAGTGQAGTSGDGGSARLAKLDFPVGLSVTPDGSLLIADHHACRVRRVSAKDGKISTVAGSTCGGGSAGEGDGGPANAALLAGPVKAVETIDGALYIADFAAHRIRRVGKDGIISTVAGTGQSGCTGGQLAGPHDIALASDGGLLIANLGGWDGGTHVCDSIQKYVPSGGLQTLVGRQLPGASSIEPQGVATTADGSIYFTPAQAVVKRPPGGGEDPQHVELGGRRRAAALRRQRDGLRRRQQTGVDEHSVLPPDSPVGWTRRHRLRDRPAEPPDPHHLVGGARGHPGGRRRPPSGRRWPRRHESHARRSKRHRP